MSDAQKAEVNIAKLFEDMKKYGITYVKMGDLEIKAERDQYTEVAMKRPDYMEGFSR